MKTTYWIIFSMLMLEPLFISGQSNNYWTRNFNETSSLLSGAVVGGGAGPSAIYYNPAIISDIAKSNFSLNASLFSFRFLTAKNAFGDDLNLKFSKGIIEPRFISYMLKPAKSPQWSFEVAFLNNENHQFEYTQSVDRRTDILSQSPGIERYFALIQYTNNYRDDWIGIGSSWNVNRKLFLGASMFATIKSLDYSHTVSCEAYPADSVYSGDFYIAEFQQVDYLKFNDYRLLWKFGIYVKGEVISFGASITTPSVGGIYSDGKKISRKIKQSNITSPETGEPLHDFVIAGYSDKKEVSVNARSPFSVSAGVNCKLQGNKKIVYTTVEYFAGIDPYLLAKAKEGQDFDGFGPGTINPDGWLTFVSGASPVFNAAIGYRWHLNENLLLMTGLRTDFNYKKDLEFTNKDENKTLDGFNIDIYHLSGGLSWNIRGQDVTTGIQYSFGCKSGGRQVINFSDPVEYNPSEKRPLQGTRQNNVNSQLNAISIYLGATINFSKSNSN